MMQDQREIEPYVDDELDEAASLEIDPDDLQPPAWAPPKRNRVIVVASVVAVLVLLVLLPPLISVNRYRKQISRSISQSLGRPVYLDSVTLNVLPMPGFTLKNFTVAEDPGFGSEPVIHADSVKVRLRVWSLWRRRVEFSRITLEDPSVNLIHRADGRWNIESILLQASKITAAPTAQTTASAAPRFPYIEATGARVNIKMGLEKMPLAFTEADFALWLPQPDHWRLRLEAKPTRTDAAATDTGTIRVQGTLGKAADLQAVPIDLTGEWRNAPLGGVSTVLTGKDAGFRGAMSLTTTLQGTVGANTIASQLELSDLRRADFVPEHTLDALIACKAQAFAVFHAFRTVDCEWQTGRDASGAQMGVQVQGEIPDVAHPETAHYKVNSLLAASELLDMVRVASNRLSPALTAAGSVSSEMEGFADGKAIASTVGTFKSAKVRLASGGAKPFLDGPVAGEYAKGELLLAPIELDLGAPQPAVLTARVDANGLSLHLSGAAMRSQLMALAKAVPQFGDGLDAVMPEVAATATVETPMRVDLISSRTWARGQSWEQVVAKPQPRRKVSRRR